MKQEIEVRATRESPGHVEWCKAGEATQFSVYQGWPGSMNWVADFNEAQDALDYARYRAVARNLQFFDRIEQ